MLYASGREQGFSTGAESACGRVVWLLTPEQALSPLAPFHRAFQQARAGAHDAAFIEDRFAVCHRVRSLDALVGFRGRKLATLKRRLARRGAGSRFSVASGAGFAPVPTSARFAS